MEYLVLYGKDMGIPDLLRYLIKSTPHGEEDANIKLVQNTTWLIQNPQWISNLHLISDGNKEISGNFISHLLDSEYDSTIESLGTYLVMDRLERWGLQIQDTLTNPTEIGSDPLRLERFSVRGGGGRSHCGYD